MYLSDAEAYCLAISTTLPIVSTPSVQRSTPLMNPIGGMFMSIDFSIKLRLIEDLAKYLEIMGKHVHTNYY